MLVVLVDWIEQEKQFKESECIKIKQTATTTDW